MHTSKRINYVTRQSRTIRNEAGLMLMLARSALSSRSVESGMGNDAQDEYDDDREDEDEDRMEVDELTEALAAWICLALALGRYLSGNARVRTVSLPGQCSAGCVLPRAPATPATHPSSSAVKLIDTGVRPRLLCGLESVRLPRLLRRSLTAMQGGVAQRAMQILQRPSESFQQLFERREEHPGAQTRKHMTPHWGGIQRNRHLACLGRGSHIEEKRVAHRTLARRDDKLLQCYTSRPPRFASRYD